MNRIPAICFFILSFVSVSCLSERPLLSAETSARVDSLLRVMTVDEKVGQLVLLTSDWDVTGPSVRADYLEAIREGRCGNIFNAFTADFTRELQRVAVEETRLGIPLLFGYDVIHGFRTIFPLNLGMACSWDIPAIEESARIAAAEAAAAGLHWTFSPMCDICVDPRWGRISEGAGEDPFLGSQVAAALTRGYQGKDLSDTLTLLACVKHYAAYGAPQAGRDYHTVDMSERWLREFYLPPYQAAIEAGALSVMASFNEYDGIPATANRRLLQEILRDEWGFRGFVVSDYTGVNEMIAHGYARDSADAARLSILAGLDMDMQSSAFAEFLAGQVARGEVPLSVLDEAVRRVLTVKEKLGLFDDPYRYCDSLREAALTMTTEHLAAARRLASESMVLLKNDKVLPIKPGHSVAVIGSLAASSDDLLGTWRAAGQTSGVMSILDALRARFGAGRISYARGCFEQGDDRSGFPAALSLAARSDVVVMVLGENCHWSGEAASRASIRLPGVQTELLRKVAALGKPVVLVLLNGRPLDISEEDALADAILEAWYPGTMGGPAVADVLSGDFNPSGKLCVTFPRMLGQVPIFHYPKNTGRPYIHPDAKYESRYLDVPNDPLYPFGHGLSYTDFRISDPKLSAASFSGSDSLTVTVTVTNFGDRDGVETVQLYLQDLLGSVTRPVRQLKAFERVALGPRETATVRFTIDASMLSFWRSDMSFGPEPGDFKLYVGASSAAVAEASFTWFE